MNQLKSWALAVVLTTAAVFMGGVAEAAPIAPTFADHIDSYVPGQANELADDKYWSLGGIGIGSATFIESDAAFESFGIFDRKDSSNRVEIFNSSHDNGNLGLFGMIADGTVVGATLGSTISFNMSASPFSGNLFGFYVQTAGETLFSDHYLNTGNTDYSTTLNGTGELVQSPNFIAGPWLDGEYLMAFGSDANNPTFGVVVGGLTPVGVSEPLSAMLLLGGLMAVGARRRAK